MSRLMARSVAAVVAGGVAAGVRGHAYCRAEAKTSIEGHMKDNLARRLARSYLATPESCQVKAGAELALFETGRPVLVTVLTDSQPVLIRMPDGSERLVPISSLHKPQFVTRIEYWQASDPSMAHTILQYMDKAEKGELIL
ncbi:hypothetical protein DIPPA_19996 [Diplonema papillatum]|nr:hypothetical protein DIPPA_19996 [Diplonema papillatum]|eukprot:gene22949-35175_t